MLKCNFAGIISVRLTHYDKREGSGAGSGFVLLTNGSGSVRPKNMRIRIRIANTVCQSTSCPFFFPLTTGSLFLWRVRPLLEYVTKRIHIEEKIMLDHWIWIRKVKKFRIRRVSLYSTSSSSTFFPFEYLFIRLAHINRTYIGDRGASVNENFLFCLFPLHSPSSKYLSSSRLSLSLCSILTSLKMPG